MAFGNTSAPINITGNIQYRLHAVSNPPTTLCRVIPSRTWLRFPFQSWLKYVISRNTGGSLLPPYLGKDSATHIYVTDEPSLNGFLEPARIARRLGLDKQTSIECTSYGCVIIRFTMSDPKVAILPAPNPNAIQQGLTVGDAREWLIPNIRLDTSMDVMYIGINPIGDPFWYHVSLSGA